MEMEMEIANRVVPLPAMHSDFGLGLEADVKGS
jgi:hypothetical protein